MGEAATAVKHLETVESAKTKLHGTILNLGVALTMAKNDPSNERLQTQVSDLLGKIHQLGENAMNEYRVNRAVAKVERHWRAAFEKERQA